MPGTKRNLSLLLLPQSWDGANLIVNLLLLPNGDPTAPVPLSSGEELSFANAQPKLRAAVLSGLTTPPWAPSIPPASITHVPLTLPYSSYETAIFAGLVTDYTPVVPSASQSSGIIRKDLPASYRQATGFQTPNADYFTAGDSFGCALGRAAIDTKPVPKRPIAWGEIISFALRQPLIAQAMGLMYLQIPIPITPALVAEGGWIWLEIDSSNTKNWYAKLVAQRPAAVSAYAARLPALKAAQDVFAAILFPTVSANYDSSVLDMAQFEADLYLDGFAKIVHANQPTTADSVTGDSTAIVPGTDAGIQIGWDDEQVTTWVNRQISTAQALAAPTPPATPVAELPFTVLGYRVDVRASVNDSWSSLCNASVTLNAPGDFSLSTGAELCVEPTPLRNGGANQDYWLPQYFAQWRGRSLVVNDQYAYAFSGGQPPAPPTTPPKDFSGTTSESLSGIGLLYGNTYQFRTRLVDLTGGGPIATDPDPTDAGIATIPFRRHVPPKQVPVTLGKVQHISGNRFLTVDRPGINYPEMVFCGAAVQQTLDDLLGILPAQPPISNPPGKYPAPFQAAVLDTDVKTLQIIVEAQAPAHDTGPLASLSDGGTPPAPGDLDGTFRVVYVWEVDYPALAGPVLVGASTPIALTLQPKETAHISSATLPDPANPTILPVPTGRNLRIRLRALGAPDPNGIYFGNTTNSAGATVSARTGLIADIRVRFESHNETGVLAAGNTDQQLQAFYLRDLDNSAQQNVVFQSVVNALTQNPNPSAGRQFLTNLRSTLVPAATTPLQLLASALNLPLNGQTLSAPPGQRILFGAQNTLRHSIPQDCSSIEFSTQKDLINHWIVVQRLTLDRDWTWSGLAQDGAGQIGFSFNGVTYPDDTPGPAVQPLGEIKLPGVVSSLATLQGSVANQRDSTELIFFSTIDSAPDAEGFPTPTSGDYKLLATLTGRPTVAVEMWSGEITVPITSNPRQIPRLVSAGLAESPYVAAPDYSSTTQRQRAVWLEFDQAPVDEHDAYFIRISNYGPDPLLASHPSDFTPPLDSPIALDPEPIRQITPDSKNDDAGIAAMTQLVPSESSAVHFLVPLPDSVSPADLQLFGFWTYEIRCGHLKWSTAQGRFGRPLRVAGVQHPCPPLTANVERIITTPTGGSDLEPCIVVSADLAQTVYAGRSLTLPRETQTDIVFLLYAQLRRADGHAWRNLLLTKLPGSEPRQLGLLRRRQVITVEAAFSQADVNDILTALNLPVNTPLSILAVELFNREDQVIPEDGEIHLESLQISNDPLGNQLGSRRILRVSPLTPVRAIC